MFWCQILTDTGHRFRTLVIDVEEHVFAPGWRAVLVFMKKMPKIDNINFNYKFESTRVTPNVSPRPVS